MMDVSELPGTARPVTSCFLATCLLVLAPSFLKAGGHVRTVALSGQRSPVEGFEFGRFHIDANEVLPVINNYGQVAFQVDLRDPTDPTTEPDFGIFRENRDRELETVGTFRENQKLLHSSPFTFTFGVMNDRGEIAVRLYADESAGFPARGTAVLSDVGGNGLQVVAHSASPSPIDDETSVVGFDNPLINKQGRIAFNAGLSGPNVDNSNRYAVFAQSPGELIQLIAREGDPSPIDGANFHILARSPSNLSLNALDQVTFFARLSGAEVDDTNDLAVFRGTSASDLTVVVRRGDPTPIGEDVRFDNFTDFVNSGLLGSNARGHTAFLARLAGPGVDDDSDRAIFAERGEGELRVIARAGEPAPVDEGVVFGRGFWDPVINNRDDVVFAANLAGPDIDLNNRSAVFVDVHGEDLRMVARQGDMEPLGSGDHFSFFETGLHWPVLNGRGQVAFKTTLDGPSVDQSNDLGFFAEDVDGNLHRVVREGDLLDVNDDPEITDLRTISELQFLARSGNGDGLPSGFNDRGELAFNAVFTDGSSGIFVSNLVATFDDLGDFDLNGEIDGHDFLLWQRGESSDPLSNRDLTDWETKFAAQAFRSLAANVPEPATAPLLVVMLLSARLGSLIRERGNAAKASNG